jgi:hypothetical protein
MILTSIYGHFRRLNLPTDYQAMNQVGMLVRDLYITTYGRRPYKRERQIGKEKFNVNVYPEEFATQVVEVIQQYLQAQQLPSPSESQSLEPVPTAPQEAAIIAAEKPKRIRQRMPIVVKTFDKVTSSDKPKMGGAV